MTNKKTSSPPGSDEPHERLQQGLILVVTALAEIAIKWTWNRK